LETSLSVSFKKETGKSKYDYDKKDTVKEIESHSMTVSLAGSSEIQLHIIEAIRATAQAKGWEVS